MEKLFLNKTVSTVPDGVQGLFLINRSINLLNQKFILVQDKDDRGMGTGIKKCGLPGGTIEEGETPEIAYEREISEEIALEEFGTFTKFGTFPKTRPNGFVNRNTLFVAKLNYEPTLATNDPGEVSKVYIFTLREIIELNKIGHIHEGSIRLILHFINGTRGNVSLNEPVELKVSSYLKWFFKSLIPPWIRLFLCYTHFMKAVILCAGEGERLKPATNTTPKPLLLIGQKSILFYIFQSLPEEIDEVFLIVQERHEYLFQKFLGGNEIELKVNILFQDKDKKGTYFALYTAKEYLIKENIFLVLNGDDIFLREDLEKLIKLDAPAYGIGYKRMDFRYRTCDLENGKIVSFRRQREEEIEKEVPCFSGAFTLNKDFFSYNIVYASNEAGIPHTLFGSGKSVSYILLNEWLQINTHEDFNLAKMRLE